MLDLLLLFLLTIFIFNKLFSNLGKTNDDIKHNNSDKRNNPLFDWLKKQHENALKEISKHQNNQSNNQEVHKTIDAEIISVAESSLDQKSRQIIKSAKEIDPRFDLDHFLEGAAKAFKVIINAFSNEEILILEQLLTKEAFLSFQNKYKEAKEKGNKVIQHIIKIGKCEVEELFLENNSTLWITLLIKSDQIYYIKNKNEEIIEGKEDQIKIIQDRWTFKKNLQEKGQNWLLAKII